MRPIDADALLRSETERCGSRPIVGTCTVDNRLLCDVLDEAPTLDVAPVVHGRWVFKTDEDAIWMTKAICSACKCTVANNTHLTQEYGKEAFEKEKNYCPNCGAKMDMEGNTND